jgi:hypothetical protein
MPGIVHDYMEARERVKRFAAEHGHDWESWVREQFNNNYAHIRKHEPELSPSRALQEAERRTITFVDNASAFDDLINDAIEYERGYAYRMKMLDRSFSEHNQHHPFASPEQNRQVVHDIAITYSKQIKFLYEDTVNRKGWKPRNPEFVRGLRKAVMDWSHKHNHELKEQIKEQQIIERPGQSQKVSAKELRARFAERLPEFQAERMRQPDVLIIDGEAYGVKPDVQHEDKQIGNSLSGFGGAEFRIQTDHGVITTHNLWYIGEVPGKYRHELPDNAKFLTPEKHPETVRTDHSLFQAGHQNKQPQTHNWNIYHLDREYASSLNDPLVGTVSAESKREAEQIASRQFDLPSGAWAVPDKQQDFRQQPDQSMTKQQIDQTVESLSQNQNKTKGVHL